MFPLQGGNPAATQIYSDDVFSAYTYTGNGTTQTITNGIDLAGKGGLVWEKIRNGSSNHFLMDTARGGNFALASNLTNAQSSGIGLTFNSNGYTYAASWGTTTNVISWTFRKAPKFFDVVTYTGNGANRTISHSLGSVPGMIIVKRTDAAADWQVYSNSIANTEYMVLNTTAAKATGATRWNSTTPTSSVFSLGTDTTVNASAGTYVAYLFAHDTAADGLIQCGSYTGTAASLNVTLGWEPQYLLIRNASQVQDWFQFDTARGLTTSGGNKTYITLNSSAAESSQGNFAPCITATGFNLQSGGASFNSSGDTFIYMAIRMPNKPPTVGTQVYNAIARTGTGGAVTVTGVGFAPDLIHPQSRDTYGANAWYDKLRGGGRLLNPNATNAETTDLSVGTFNQNGFSCTGGVADYSNYTGVTYINHFFKRAPGVFDEVCYTGTGANLTVTHGLGAVPELMIVKARSSAGWNWAVYEASQGATKKGWLNSTTAFGTSSPMWNNTAPTLTTFTVGAGDDTNPAAAVTMVAYLFATKAGISKVGTYTGNGTSQTINAGFTTGARWVMIKRTDSTGDWYVWDSTRGIVAGNDPHLSLNTTAAEVTTDDSVDTDTTGFIVNQLAATNINVTSATYIYLSFA